MNNLQRNQGGNEKLLKDYKKKKKEEENGKWIDQKSELISMQMHCDIFSVSLNFFQYVQKIFRLRKVHQTVTTKDYYGKYI